MQSQFYSLIDIVCVQLLMLISLFQTLLEAMICNVDKSCAPNYSMMLLWASLANAIPVGSKLYVLVNCNLCPHPWIRARAITLLTNPKGWAKCKNHDLLKEQDDCSLIRRQGGQRTGQ